MVVIRWKDIFERLEDAIDATEHIANTLSNIVDIMAVDVEPGDVPRFSAPHELFRVPAESYDVSPDGQRFVTATFAASATDKPLTLITHWMSRLAKR